MKKARFKTFCLKQTYSHRLHIVLLGFSSFQHSINCVQTETQENQLKRGKMVVIEFSINFLKTQINQFNKTLPKYFSNIPKYLQNLIIQALFYYCKKLRSF